MLVRPYHSGLTRGLFVWVSRTLKMYKGVGVESGSDGIDAIPPNNQCNQENHVKAVAAIGINATKHDSP